MSALSRSLGRGLSVFVAALVLAAFSVRPAFAAPYDYTDNWYVPSEAGWGVNFTQSDDFIFGSLFVYDVNKVPTWYSAQMTWDGVSQFTGGLYLTHGSYFGGPWNPSDNTGATLVGTATFTPSTANNYQGTFVYSVTNVGTITKAVTRLTLTPVLLAANYVGGQSGGYSGAGCNLNGTYQDFFTLAVTQTGMNVNMAFTYAGTNPPTTCTIAGTMIQNGSIFRIPTATYQCSNGLNTNATVSDLRATPLGIEGQFTAPSVGGGCSETARFSGTLN